MADPYHTCPWCRASFSPRRTGGSPQVFCSQSCKRIVEAKSRKWIVDALINGTITADDLRAPLAPRALPESAVSVFSGQAWPTYA